MQLFALMIVNLSFFNKIKVKETVPVNTGIRFDVIPSAKAPPEVLNKKSVLKIVAKFTGKHLCQGLVFKT